MPTRNVRIISTAEADPTQELDEKVEEITDTQSVATGVSTVTFAFTEDVENVVASVSVVPVSGGPSDINYNYSVDEANNEININVDNVSGASVDVDFVVNAMYSTD